MWGEFKSGFEYFWNAFTGSWTNMWGFIIAMFLFNTFGELFKFIVKGIYHVVTRYFAGHR